MRLTLAALTLVLLTPGAFAADSAQSKLSVADIRADFTELYQRTQVSHFDLYARRSKAEYDALFATTLASLTTPLTLVEAEARFQEFLAYGKVAHARIESRTNAFAAYRQAGGAVIPLGIRIVKGICYVTEDSSGLGQIVPGDEIVALNGAPMKDLLERLGAQVSADNDYMLHALLEFDFPKLLWREFGRVEQFDVRIRTPSGDIKNVVIPGRTAEQIASARESAPKRLALDWDAREARMLNETVAYLRPGPFYNNAPGATNMWDTSAFAAFIDESFQRFDQARAQSIIIDLRDNPGGDNSFSDRMVSWYATKPYRFVSAFRIKVSQAAIAANEERVKLAKNADDISHKLAAAYAKRRPGEVFSFDVPLQQPRAGRRFEGRVYLLINRHSYSNTVMVAALSQDYGFAVILGEETSDLGTTFGSMEQFELARSGIRVGFPKALLIRPSGDTSVRGVVPDVPIETPIVEAGDDPVLKRAIEIAHGELQGGARAGVSPTRSSPDLFIMPPRAPR